LRLALIAIFGAAGTLARYGLQGIVQIRTASTFPLGTLLVNLTGCFLLGLIGQFTLNRMVISPDWRVAIAVGFFGGLHHFLEFRLGNRQDAGRRRVGTRHGLRRSERSRRPDVERRWHSAGQPLVSKGSRELD
jgi:protein CrcB